MPHLRSPIAPSPASHGPSTPTCCQACFPQAEPSPQHPPLSSTAVGHHTLSILFRTPPLSLRSPQPSTVGRPGSHSSLWMLCGSFLPWPLELRDASPDTQAQLALLPHSISSASIQSPEPTSGPDPCLTLMSGLHPTLGMDSPPTRHMASYSSRLSARYPLRCLPPLHLIPACPARTRATIWHSGPSAGTCCCTSSTPGI